MRDVQPIWVGDAASIAVDAIEDDDHVDVVYDLGGPEVSTFGEVTRLLYRAEGRSVTIPMGLAKLALTAVDPIRSIPLGADPGRRCVPGRPGRSGRSVGHVRFLPGWCLTDTGYVFLSYQKS